MTMTPIFERYGTQVITWKGVTNFEKEPTRTCITRIPYEGQENEAYQLQQLILTKNPQLFPGYKIVRKFFDKFAIYKEETHTVVTWATAFNAIMEIHYDYIESLKH